MSLICIVRPNNNYDRERGDATVFFCNNSDGGGGDGWVHSDCDGFNVRGIGNYAESEK